AEELLRHSASLVHIGTLREGLIPSEKEAARGEKYASDLSSELDLVDAEIRLLFALREKLFGQLQLTRAYIAPARRLPTELLHEIFRHFAEDIYEDRTLIVLRTLAHVCSSWRAAVWSSPILWTCITTKASIPFDLLDSEITLSRELPLYICQRRGTEYKSLTKLLPPLLAHAERWGEISFSDGSDVFASIPPVDFRTLWSASICLLTLHADDDAPLEFLEHASSLQQLRLQLDTRIETPELLDRGLGLPSVPLTILTLGLGHVFDSSIASLVPILDACTGTLQELTIVSHPHSTSRRNDMRDSATVVPRRLPCLRKLDLAYHTHDILDV
ncbi:hypothetical protein HDZ31DRAFT_32950, partial [Schizophyllum fasciatum]